MPSLIVAGAHILCYINGRLYAQVSEFKWSSSTPRKAIHGIDSPDPFELAPTITIIKGEAKVFRLSGDGGFQGLGISASFSDLPKEKYFSVQIVDRRSDTVIFECPTCAQESESWAAIAKSLMTGTLSFTGISWGNEATRS